MKQFADLAALAAYTEKQGSAVALGYFDGVHLGHQSVIGGAVDYAKKQGLIPATFTFLFQSSRTKGLNLYTEEMRRRTLNSLGMEVYAAPSFDSFRDLSAAEFVQQVLKEGFHAKAVFCGEDFRFGKGAEGDVSMLQTLCAAQKIEVFICDMALFEGEVVSSTRIRNALSAGEMERVNAMLGRPYEIAFPVRHGKQLGRTLGFPTINQIYPENMHLPKYGIYITQVLVGDKAYPSATGFGERPTVNGTGATCETFIPDFQGDLYEETPTVRFYQYIAPSRKFDNLEQLQACVFGAAEAAQKYFAEKTEQK